MVTDYSVAAIARCICRYPLTFARFRKERERKKKKKKGRVFEQSNRQLFIILSRYIYIYKTPSISFFFFFFLSIYFILFSIHLYRITYAIFIRSRFFTFFSFISQPLLCYRRATACTCDYSACKVNLCSNKNCIYSKGGEGGKRGEREGGRMGWRRETPRVLSSESIQLNIDQLRFLLIHRSRILANELYLPLRENFSRTQIINRFNESFLYNRRA